MILEQFKQDVLFGLSQTPKQIPSKYFYDKRGDELFVQIMNMPEYYLTRAEMEIFQQQSKDIISSFDIQKGEEIEVVELGAGDGTKTIHLLFELIRSRVTFKYIPIDISSNALIGLEHRMKEEIPELAINSLHGDYFQMLNDLKKSPNRKIILFLGSNIGNMSDEQAKLFIASLSGNLNKGDKIVLGVDLIKEKEVVLPAYNDVAGITRDFNLNLLERMNRELHADFDLNAFVHDPEYHESEGIAKSFLKSTKKQVVTIESIHEQFVFEENERIHTEISRKYNDLILDKIIDKSPLSVQHCFTDQKSWFGDYIINRV
nr:L-histidine N(alpha)-methyltransferase [uncultured Fluviicola sp.]